MQRYSFPAIKASLLHFYVGILVGLLHFYEGILVCYLHFYMGISGHRHTSVCRLLRKCRGSLHLSEYADKTYFKGGTSLSKAYGLIERFLEDLDLFVFTGDKDAVEHKNRIKNNRIRCRSKLCDASKSFIG